MAKDRVNARVHLIPIVKDLQLGLVELAVIGADFFLPDRRFPNSPATVPSCEAIVRAALSVYIFLRCDIKYGSYTLMSLFISLAMKIDLPLRET